jgi:hypothetical protein
MTEIVPSCDLNPENEKYYDELNMYDHYTENPN